MASIAKFKDKISDFDASFAAHPVNDDFIIKQDNYAINQHLKLLLIPGRYASLFRPNKTAGISELLFDADSPGIRQSIRDRIRITVSENIPNISVNDIIVEVDNNSVGINVKYHIKDSSTEFVYSSRLKRTR